MFFHRESYCSLYYYHYEITHMTKPTKIKIDTLFDSCCKQIDDEGVPKMINPMAYLVTNEPTKLIVKGMLYTMLMII
jgi:hypothetical protein